MNINDYIINNIKSLTLESTVKNARKICKNYPISHIPILKKNKLIGCFSESDIRTIEDSNCKLEDHSFLLQFFFTDKKATVLELISLFADNDCNLIPVLDTNKNYIGYYDLADILDVFANSPFLHRDNETLVIEKNKTDFSMSQVTQIVESNNIKLVGCYISQETSDFTQATIKVASKELNEIIQTFRRYDYTIVTAHITDEYIEELKDRAEYFKRYLDI